MSLSVLCLRGHLPTPVHPFSTNTDRDRTGLCPGPSDRKGEGDVTQECEGRVPNNDLLSTFRSIVRKFCVLDQIRK